MKVSSKILILLVLLSFVGRAGLSTHGHTELSGQAELSGRTELSEQTELSALGQTESAMQAELPTATNDLFSGSGNCLLCHNSMTNAQGEPVGIINDWRSTMMANAARDPFWRAKVSHEGLVNPGHQQALEDVCISCHAPLAHYNAHYLGQSYYSIMEMVSDPLGLDGVSCTSCHQLTEASMGNYSGKFLIGEQKQTWGPYMDPFATPMVNNTGYTPVYGTQINDALLCASCHTLITNSVDTSGVPTGGTFVEQAIYQEWLNSVYPDQGISCQSCHVPRIDDVVKISSTPPWLEGRTPFGMHYLVGANKFMLSIIRDNIDELGATATVDQFNTSIERVMHMLQDSSVTMDIMEIQRTQDSLFIEVSLQNISGHKFPSGYPSRRAFMEFLVRTEAGDTVFHSGKLGQEFYLSGEDSLFEPHYQVIHAEEQVQIYEMVMGNFVGEPTTILEQASVQLKDNRLPPQGFTNYHNSYDTVQIVGHANSDPDFNIQNGTQGSGLDKVHYHIPVAGQNGTLEVTARLFYQTVSPKWLEHMFTYNSPGINTFKGFYENADKNPVKVAEKSLSSASTGTGDAIQGLAACLLYPNPARDHFFVKSSPDKILFLEIFTLSGMKIRRINLNDKEGRVELYEKPGIYIIKITFSDGNNQAGKLIIH